MSEWLSLMQMEGITLIPEDSNPTEVQAIADIGWFSILVAGKLYSENKSLSPQQFLNRVGEDIRDSYFNLGLADRLECEFCVRLTWVCYETMVVLFFVIIFHQLKAKNAGVEKMLRNLTICGRCHMGDLLIQQNPTGTSDHQWNFMPTCMFHNRQKATAPMLIYKPGFLADLKTYIFTRTTSFDVLT